MVVHDRRIFEDEDEEEAHSCISEVNFMPF